MATKTTLELINIVELFEQLNGIIKNAKTFTNFYTIHTTYITREDYLEAKTELNNRLAKGEI